MCCCVPVITTTTTRCRLIKQTNKQQQQKHNYRLVHNQRTVLSRGNILSTNEVLHISTVLESLGHWCMVGVQSSTQTRALFAAVSGLYTNLKPSLTFNIGYRHKSAVVPKMLSYSFIIVAFVAVFTVYVTNGSGICF